MKKFMCWIIMLAVMLSQASCTSFTKDLWADTDPNHGLWINADEITEEELQSRGVTYRRVSTENMEGFIVEKADRDKLKDYTYRVLGTPVTLIADAAATAGVAVVVGGVLFIEVGGWELLNGVCN